MSITRWQAMAAAARTSTWAVGMCDNFCANMYGWSASGYVDATAHWNALSGPDRHPGDHNVPAGMLAFWGGGHGHIAISDGAGSVWSTDISGAGTVTKVPLSRIASAWGKPYLGWGRPIFQGAEWSDMSIPGCDISDYQAASGWETGRDFVVIKITEGTTYTNPKWTSQRATARSANLVRGYYHFARGGSMTAQADYFLSKISLDPGEFLVLDWEDTNVSSAQKDEWINYVRSHRSGYRVLLYCNRDYWLNRDTSGFYGDGLWIADPDVPAGQPRVSAPWVLHQYGSPGGLDVDVAQFDSRADMLTWMTGGNIVEWTDNLSIPAGTWSPDAESDSAGDWLVYANKKAEKAANNAAAAASSAAAAASSAATASSKATAAATAATSAAAQSAANGTSLTTLGTKVDTLQAAVTALETTGLTPEQVDAIGTKVTEVVTSDSFLELLANKFADVEAARMAE